MKMGIIKTKGIIISESNMADFDKMVTILTPTRKNWVCSQTVQEDQKVH